MDGAQVRGTGTETKCVGSERATNTLLNKVSHQAQLHFKGLKTDFSFVLFFSFSETRFYFASQAGLELTILLLPLP
jgi:hypothetical protein